MSRKRPRYGCVLRTWARGTLVFLDIRVPALCNFRYQAFPWLILQRCGVWSKCGIPRRPGWRGGLDGFHEDRFNMDCFRRVVSMEPRDARAMRQSKGQVLVGAMVCKASLWLSPRSTVRLLTGMCSRLSARVPSSQSKHQGRLGNSKAGANNHKTELAVVEEEKYCWWSVS